MKNCRICGFLSQPEATRCAVCHSEFDPSTVKISGKSIHYGQKTIKKRITEIIIFFILSCILLLPVLLIADSLGLVIENPLVMIVCSFAIIFTLLFMGHTYMEKKNRNNASFEDNDESSYYGNDDILSEIDTLNEKEDEEKKDKSSITFREHVAALLKQSPDTTVSFNAQMTVEAATSKMAQSSKLSAPLLRSVLAAMASRRLIVICGESEGVTTSAMQSVSALTGIETLDVTLDENCEDTTSLFAVENSEKDPLPSQFLSALCVCGENPAIYCIDLKAENTNQLTTAFADLIPYIEHAFTGTNVKVKGVNRKFVNIAKDETIALPANRRIFLRVSSDRKIPLGAELLQVAAWIEAKEVASLNAVEDTSDTPEAVAALSFERLLQLAEESEKVCYLTEETWKRIDELCDYLAQTVEFCMDNKLAVAMERFIGIYMASGGTEQEAADAENSEGSENIPVEKTAITVTPSYISKQYDGTPLIASNQIDPDETLLKLLQSGFTYEVTVVGSRTRVGKGESQITEFRLYNAQHTDVTDHYNIIFQKGVLEVLDAEAKIIHVYLYQLQKYYDGTELAFDSGDYEVDGIAPGHRLELDLHISLTDVGSISLSKIQEKRADYANFRVFAGSVDVTHLYALSFEAPTESAEHYVPIRIDPRMLEITANSVSKEDDGAPLIPQGATITLGSLASGYELLPLTVKGHQSGVGSSMCYVDSNSITILDQYGKNVTKNYDISRRDGILEICAPNS